MGTCAIGTRISKVALACLAYHPVRGFWIGFPDTAQPSLELKTELTTGES
jgi:hypothetical protein